MSSNAPRNSPGTPAPAFPARLAAGIEPGRAERFPDLEGYRLIREIGRGGMGRVYEAVQASLGRRVAIKELHCGDDRLLARFRREAAILARLGDHENLAQVFDVITRHGQHYIVMEHVDGVALSTALDARGRLDLSDALRVAVGVARALEHAHANGVVHRDVKPANVMVNHRGVVKVMDFGIARSDEESRITLTGQTLGTPTYMSPEQADGEQDVDERSDLYSLAVLLYHMACGRPPFRSPSALATLRMHLETPAPPPSAFYGALDAEFDALALKGLEKRRSARYQTAEGFRHALESYARRAGMERAFDATPSSGSWLSASSLGGAVGLLEGAPLAPTTPSGDAVQTAGSSEEEAPRGLESTRPPRPGDVGRPARAPSSAALFAKLGLRAPEKPARAARVAWERGEAVSPPPKDRPIRPGEKPRGKRFAKLDAALGGVAITPDGQTAILGAVDGSLRLWNVRHGVEALLLAESGAPIRGVAASPNGRLALSCGADGVATLWDLAAGRALRRLEGDGGELRCCAFSADGRRAVCGGDGRKAAAWDLVSGDRLFELAEHGATVSACAFHATPEGERIATTSEDGAVRLWGAKGEPLREIAVAGTVDVAETPGLSAMAVSSDGAKALVGGASGVARWIDLATGKTERRLEPTRPRPIGGLAVSPDGRRALVAADDPRVLAWSLETGETVMRFEGHAAGATCAAMSPSGRWALTGGRDGEVWAWNLA